MTFPSLNKTGTVWHYQHPNHKELKGVIASLTRWTESLTQGKLLRRFSVMTRKWSFHNIWSKTAGFPGITKYIPTGQYANYKICISSNQQVVHLKTFMQNLLALSLQTKRFVVCYVSLELLQADDLLCCVQLRKFWKYDKVNGAGGFYDFDAIFVLAPFKSDEVIVLLLSTACSNHLCLYIIDIAFPHSKTFLLVTCRLHLYNAVESRHKQQQTLHWAQLSTRQLRSIGTKLWWWDLVTEHTIIIKLYFNDMYQ